MKLKAPAASRAAIWPAKPVTTDEDLLRQAIVDTASRFIGKTERTNNNDADWIAMINLSNRLPERAMYCASAYYYCHRANGVRLGIPAVSVGRVAAYFRDPGKIIWKPNHRGNLRVKPRQADAVSIFASHIEMIYDKRYDPTEDDEVKLIGFNTSGGRGTKGGCYVNRRRTRELKAIANWISPHLQQLTQ